MRSDAILLVVMAVLPPGQALLADATRLKAPFPPTSAAPARRRQQPMTMMAPRFASREDMFAMMKQLNKDGAGEWSTPLAPREKSPERETTPEQIKADAKCVFAVLDYDGDGQLTIAELSQHLGGAGYSVAAIANLFDTVDIDKDGEISCDELCACFARFATLRQEPGLGDFDVDFVDESNLMADELFDQIDIDGDGQITKVELQAHLKESSYSEAAVGAIFDAIDVNDDGELSREELRGGLARYGALRLALGVGKYYDYEDPNSSGSKPTEYRYFW